MLEILGREKEEKEKGPLAKEEKREKKAESQEKLWKEMYEKHFFREQQQPWQRGFILGEDENMMGSFERDLPLKIEKHAFFREGREGEYQTVSHK